MMPQYEDVLTGSYVTGPNNQVYFYVPSVRKNSATLSQRHKRERLRPKVRQRIADYRTYKSPVYQPHVVGIFDENHYLGPESINDDPSIEHIRYKGKDIFFGMINGKIAMYSTFFDTAGKKQMQLYHVEHIDPENENRLFLKQQALTFLSMLRNEDRKDYTQYLNRVQQSEQDFSYSDAA
jgi:hypothetical protein